MNRSFKPIDAPSRGAIPDGVRMRSGQTVGEHRTLYDKHSHANASRLSSTRRLRVGACELDRGFSPDLTFACAKPIEMSGRPIGVTPDDRI